MASHTKFSVDITRHEDETATAMDIDADFEEEETIDSLKPTRPAPVSRTTNALSKLIESDTASDSDEAPVQVPRGKLLARLQPQLAENTSDSEDDDDGEAARERIKKLLMTGPAQQESQKTSERISLDMLDSVSSEDDEDLPVRANKARRLGMRKENSSPRSLPSPSIRSRRPSPGLFVTPNASPVANKVSRTAAPAESDSESDNFSKPTYNSDLNERVNRIRAERKAGQRKAREQEKRAENIQPRAEQESDSDPDGENGRRLTQQSRPTRKAGKKALEEMARDQQRISRNMQLTHQAKTKKRYGTKDLFAKLGFNLQQPPAAAILTPDASSILASSDAEGNQAHDTPPSSPPSQEDSVEKVDTATNGATTRAIENPQKEESTSLVPAKANKGKGRAPEFQHVPLNPLIEQARPITVQNARIEPKKPTMTKMVELSDSDDDLEIVQPKSRFPVFDRLPQQKNQEAPSLLHLRHLAHLASPGKKGPKGRNSMNVTELQFSLALKARQQAHKEREERLEDLRRRGIHIETEEEREKQQLEIEDMVAQFEKARQEDLKLGKLEREKAKKNGETGDGLISSDESEDEDYVASGEEDSGEVEEADGIEEEAELELSGSEEEDVEDEADDEEELDEDDRAEKSNGLFDEMADEDDEGEPEDASHRGQLNDDDDIEDEVVSAPIRKHIVNRARNVIIDDEDETEDEVPKASTPTQQVAAPSQATQEDAMAAFGFNNAGATLGLTQLFAGTMASLESDSQTTHPLDMEPEQDSLDFLRSLPDTQPGASFSQAVDLLVPNSQAQASQQEHSQASPVSQINLGISQLIETSPAFSHTQLSEMPEPTQDVGFKLSRSPAGLVPPPSTIDTVMMPIAESPVMKRRGRLQRRKGKVVGEFSDANEDSGASESDLDDGKGTAKAANAFTVMKKAATKKQVIDNFNKKTSWARDVIEEQAEESEDEYAGIGGASDEDSGEEDEELAKMIDTNEVKIDERKIAAFFAEKSKADDEKNINQLYKDIMNGGLRRRRGGDAFDMSDSEDEAEQRRRKKQNEFRQMTKALVADERIGEIAHNPKKSAFFHTLADHMADPEYEFLNAPEMEVDMDTSQSQSQDKEGNDSTEMSIPDSQTADSTTPINPLKRKSTDSQEKENRPPPHLRRTAPSDNLARKPITFADVQHSVSELLDDPRIIVPDSQYLSSESEDETHVPKPISRKPMIDRLTLSRTASMDADSTAAGNMAFHAPSAGAQPGFRIPSLIRRATSKLSAVSTTSSGASTPVEAGVRRGGTERSNIHAQAREAERRAMLEKTEMKRKESLKKKVGKARGQRSVLRDLGGGFE